MKQTALEWFFDNLKTHEIQAWHYKLYQQAKEIEKQQIMDATCFGEYINDDKEIAERYYNENYKSK
jgi:hypothetical protein